jgi:putative SOS response-associated peptidase YedK
MCSSLMSAAEEARLMCGRFALYSDIKVLGSRFKFSDLTGVYKSSRNVSPTERILTVVDHGGRQAMMMKWGLIPSWAKDSKFGASMINARAETIYNKPAFRESFQHKRCLILADGFFEWVIVNGEKEPYFIQLKSGLSFAFAGLWNRWSAPNGEEIDTCTIITCEPNELMASIHSRMPVILSEASESIWLSPANNGTKLLSDLMAPYPSDQLCTSKVMTGASDLNRQIGMLDFV